MLTRMNLVKTRKYLYSMAKLFILTIQSVKM